MSVKYWCDVRLERERQAHDDEVDSSLMKVHDVKVEASVLSVSCQLIHVNVFLSCSCPVLSCPVLLMSCRLVLVLSCVVCCHVSSRLVSVMSRLVSSCLVSSRHVLSCLLCCVVFSVVVLLFCCCLCLKLEWHWNFWKGFHQERSYRESLWAALMVVSCVRGEGERSVCIERRSGTVVVHYHKPCPRSDTGHHAHMFHTCGLWCRYHTGTFWTYTRRRLVATLTLDGFFFSRFFTQSAAYDMIWHNTPNTHHDHQRHTPHNWQHGDRHRGKRRRCMCWKYALSKMYAACVELDTRPNSLRSLI